ncbi:MAG: L-rhamnose mutarotase [Bacteroidota bacterium]
MNHVRRYCLALDLKDDSDLIEAYKKHHAPGGVWPEILESIREAGIQLMEIYLTGNRLFMIIEPSEDFTFEAKAHMDQKNSTVQEWEALMDTFQQRLPWAKEDEKWVLMEKIFTTPMQE